MLDKIIAIVGTVAFILTLFFVASGLVWPALVTTIIGCLATFYIFRPSTLKDIRYTDIRFRWWNKNA